MAETITNVLQITMQDTDNNNFSFNIENPNEGVTIQQVNAALEPLIETQKWYSAKDKLVTRVKSATLTRTRKIVLEDSTEITVTPDEWTATIQRNQSVNQTFTVTGEAIQGYNLIQTTQNAITIENINIDTIANSVTLTIKASSNFTGNFIIVTTTQTLSIPINLTITN